MALVPSNENFVERAWDDGATPTGNARNPERVGIFFRKLPKSNGGFEKFSTYPSDSRFSQLSVF